VTNQTTVSRGIKQNPRGTAVEQQDKLLNQVVMTGWNCRTWRFAVAHPELGQRLLKIEKAFWSCVSEVDVKTSPTAGAGTLGETKRLGITG
jgi:hypothetical protein